MLEQDVRSYSVADAAELYQIERWGKGYFRIDEAGHLGVHPTRQPDRRIDLKKLVDRLVDRQIDPPILIRVGELLGHRLSEIHEAFANAIDDHHYTGRYVCVYPIKVNQQRQVVEEVLKFGAPYRAGLEAGSKPELLAVLALAEGDTPIICNGFKDAEYIELALLAQKIGKNVLPVVEKFSELEAILDTAVRIELRPRFGIRTKLSTRGAGRWQSSSGCRSKFGLSVSELLAALSMLRERDMADCFELLHFHLGSQITNIRRIKSALVEAARIYVELAERGAGLKYLDVGGGLGVDYDGSQTAFDSSMNYTLQEYANDVVYHLQSVCDDAGVPHPIILSESGRAIVAYHSLLVFNVLGVSRPGLATNIHADGNTELPEKPEQPIVDLQDTYEHLNIRNLLESFHDAQTAYEMAIDLFNGGYLPIDQRSTAEDLFWAICRKIDKLTQQLEFVPEELEGLDAVLAETYYCNFSLFQSMPDSWAVKQLFPVMPIHRLRERPVKSAVLADITCDSDGKIDQFLDRRDMKRTLPLHPPGDEPYYLAAFLLGAYQEILGDLHNLFGDTNAVHVSLDDDGESVIETFVKGDSVREVLGYVQFDVATLSARMRDQVAAAVASARIDKSHAARFMRRYEEGLKGYTYLEGDRWTS